MSEEEVKQNIAERADVAMKKLAAKDGDIVVVTFPQHVGDEQIAAFAQYMTDSIPEGVTVMCVKDNMTFELLPKEKLNALGWYNMNDNIGSSTIQ